MHGRLPVCIRNISLSSGGNNALDFDDLIVKTVELFQHNPDILDYYQERFKYIMVDEYQDTNFAQHSIVLQLTQEHQRVCVVGG